MSAKFLDVMVILLYLISAKCNMFLFLVIVLVIDSGRYQKALNSHTVLKYFFILSPFFLAYKLSKCQKSEQRGLLLNV